MLRHQMGSTLHRGSDGLSEPWVVFDLALAAARSWLVFSSARIWFAILRCGKWQLGRDVDGFPVLTLPKWEPVSSGCWNSVQLQGDGWDRKINLCLPSSHSPEGNCLMGHSYDTVERASGFCWSRGLKKEEEGDGQAQERS